MFVYSEPYLSCRVAHRHHFLFAVVSLIRVRKSAWRLASAPGRLWQLPLTDFSQGGHQAFKLVRYRMVQPYRRQQVLERPLGEGVRLFKTCSPLSASVWWSFTFFRERAVSGA